MSPEAMVKKALANRVLTANLCIVMAGNNVVDVFNNHDYNDWSRYGFHKGRWYHQRGTKLAFPAFKEMCDGIARED